MGESFVMKTILVLSGGGAKGSVQLGFMKYLIEQGLNPDIVYGTSVGALNSAGLSFCGIEKLEQIWRGIKKTSHVFKFNWSTLLFLSKGFYNAKPLKALLEKNIVGEAKIPAYACKVSLCTGEVKYTKHDEPDYIDSIVASASVPVLTEPTGEWVDGGVREQTPLKKAIQEGADKIVVIMCNPFVKNPQLDKVGNFLKNAIRTSDIISHEIMLNDIENCEWYNQARIPGKRYVQLEVYAPEQVVIETGDFNEEKIDRAIAYGYEQAKKGPIIKQ